MMMRKKNHRRRNRTVACLLTTQQRKDIWGQLAAGKTLHEIAAADEAVVEEAGAG